MSTITQIICDGPNCTVIKKDSNHWFIMRAMRIDNGFHLYPMASTDPIEGDLHVCSAGCAHALLEGWMQQLMTASTEESEGSVFA